MIQISAKLGDIPWGFKDLSLMEKPTMVIGIEHCQALEIGQKSILGFVASMNK